MTRLSYSTEARRVPRNDGTSRTVLEIKCCGVWLECRGFTNTCERCDSDFNSAGQRLAPRSFWGAETGEHALDCR